MPRVKSSAYGLAQAHWWKKPLWSRFMWAIGFGCRTGINNSGPMLVPVPARTGTDRSPRGRARSEGAWIIGPGSWHEPGSFISAFRAIFVQRQGFVFFSFIYLVCFVFNLMVLHIYMNNEGTTLYMYITHHGHKYIIHRHIHRAWSKHITNGTHTNLI
jgi:hypothetical protein